jgi:hypothetical protein
MYQVVLAAGHGVLGMVGVQLVTVALWSITLFLCFRACRLSAPTTLSAVLVFVAAMASVERFLPRPELVTFAGIAAFYWLLQSGRFRTPVQLAILAIAQIVWTNSHGLFVIGPLMVGAYLVVAVIRRIWAPDTEILPLARALLVVLGEPCSSSWGPPC